MIQLIVMGQQKGFTVVELIVVIVLLLGSAFLLIQQNNHADQVARDKERKTAINAIHLSLEEVYFKENKNYPKKINTSILPSVDSSLFEDPNDNQINTPESDYHYEPADCQGDKCKSYLLYADLEKEARYEKRSQ